jgi:hypothetical protein
LPKDKAAKAETVQVPPQERLSLLEGFADIVHERFGYGVARKLKQQEMGEATKQESKKVRETSKAITTKIEAFIETPSDEIKTEIIDKRKELKGARDSLKTSRKPFLEKITPLAKAIRYLDGVVIPDSLKELGKPIQPMFNLSKWVNEALETTKKKQ